MKLLRSLPTLLLFYVCCGMFYPPIFWHKDNCAFRSLQENQDSNGTKEFLIKVVPNTGMNVVCPNHVTINNWLKDAGISSPSLMENMWQVDKQGFDKCKVNEQGDPNINKLVLLCDRPRETKNTVFLFNPTFNSAEPKFATGQHYYFISTSRGFKDELTTRKVSGSDGSCERYHMKLHIYVCNPKKEDCVWEMPICKSLPELYRDMRLIDGKRPAPTLPRPKSIKTITLKLTTKRKKTNGYDKFKETEPIQTTLSSSNTPETLPMCNKKESSIYLTLNFILGGIAIFMAIVIIILVFGLSGKTKSYKMDVPVSNIPTSHDPKNYLTMEVVQFPDGHTQLSPIIISRTPPTSPSHIVDQVPRRAVHRLPNTPPETPHSNEERQFVFPERRHSYSGTSSARDSGEGPVPV